MNRDPELIEAVSGAEEIGCAVLAAVVILVVAVGVVALFAWVF